MTLSKLQRITVLELYLQLLIDEKTFSSPLPSACINTSQWSGTSLAFEVWSISWPLYQNAAVLHSLSCTWVLSASMRVRDPICLDFPLEQPSTTFRLSIYMPIVAWLILQKIFHSEPLYVQFKRCVFGFLSLPAQPHCFLKVTNHQMRAVKNRYVIEENGSGYYNFTALHSKGMYLHPPQT